MPFQKGNKLARSRKGTKNVLAASVKDAIREVINQNPAVVSDAVLRGLKSGPPRSYGYLKLAAEYLDGKPTETVDMNVSGKQTIVHEHYDGVCKQCRHGAVDQSIGLWSVRERTVSEK